MCRCFHGALDHKSTNLPPKKSSVIPSLNYTNSSPDRMKCAASVGSSPSAVRLLPAIDYCPRTATGPLCVRGRAAKKFKRKAPMLWFVAVVVSLRSVLEPACMRACRLSLRLDWRSSTAEQRGALQQVLQKTATPRQVAATAHEETFSTRGQERTVRAQP